MKAFLPLLLLPTLLLAATDEGRTVEGKITVGDRERSYLVHVPASYTKDKPAPLVFVFHGGGSTAKSNERFTGFSAKADRENFLVVYPEGVDKGWNDGRGSAKVTAQRENVDDIGFVTALLDRLEKDYAVDPKRIYATGISNGGFFSNRVGAELSERFAAIAPLCSGMPPPIAEKFDPASPVSVLVINGTADPLVPYDAGEVRIMGRTGRGRTLGTDETVAKWVKRNACKSKPVTSELADKDPDDGARVKIFTWGDGRDHTEVVLYRVEGGGHTWPGGRQYLRKAAVGNVCRDFDATDVIWEFFAKHPKP